MTPAARIAAAIEILDRVLAGAPAEQVLTSWGRSNRFAGSKDRAAIRDHVFDGLRNKLRFAALGGAAEAPTGRAVMLGAIWDSGADPADYFTGERYAPAPLRAEEQSPCVVPDGHEWNLPPWLSVRFREDLGAQALAQAQALCGRAPITIRVNAARTTRQDVMADLAAAGFTARENSLCETALTLDGQARGLTQTDSYSKGLFELQDAASQAVIAAIPADNPSRILDYCAGGGGKTLALAARYPGAHRVAHDAAAERMRDIPNRAARAGVTIHTVANVRALGSKPYDLVLLDVPCSGSGSWRRAPEAKWTLTRERLDALERLQAEILRETTAFVAPGGTLAYATCSVLASENQAQIDRFLAGNSDWSLIHTQAWPISPEGDGFFLAVLRAPMSGAI